MKGSSPLVLTQMISSLIENLTTVRPRRKTVEMEEDFLEYICAKNNPAGSRALSLVEDNPSAACTSATLPTAVDATVISAEIEPSSFGNPEVVTERSDIWFSDSDQAVLFKEDYSSQMAANDVRPTKYLEHLLPSSESESDALKERNISEQRRLVAAGLKQSELSDSNNDMRLSATSQSDSTLCSSQSTVLGTDESFEELAAAELAPADMVTSTTSTLSFVRCSAEQNSEEAGSSPSDPPEPLENRPPRSEGPPLHDSDEHSGSDLVSEGVIISSGDCHSKVNLLL